MVTATNARRSVAIFDLGGVLLEWNPRHLYRKLFAGDEAGMEHFLATVCTVDWNEEQDAGRPFAEAVEALMPQHADKRALIEAWRLRFDEMIPGAIEGGVAVLAEVKERGVPIYAISNWSAETFPTQRERFPFLAWFRDIAISGEERVIKPDPRIFRALLARNGLAPDSAVFIDDDPRNAAAASAQGIHGIHFRDPQTLRRDLAAVGIL